ncbi:MAG TPA: DUF2782 domain-containing protein [Rudaea sp.]|nr:DUF2782 domain-containing protein [Rudaea sp.]
MKVTCLLSIMLLGMSVAGIAQDRAADKTGLPPVQSPPGINDPGVKHAQPATAAPAAKPTKGVEKIARAPESPGLPANVQAAAEVAELPVITVRQSGSDTVEEYRKHGKLYFVRVVTKNGPTKYYVDNPGDIPPNLMRQMTAPSGVVQPVYYKLYQWK